MRILHIFSSFVLHDTLQFMVSKMMVYKYLIRPSKKVHKIKRFAILIMHFNNCYNLKKSSDSLNALKMLTSEETSRVSQITPTMTNNS